MIGRTIGKYRIVEQIGRGGMGTVYKALDETLGRQVAIKVLNADVIEAESIERFRREALTLARLNHPRIAAIHELTRDGHDLLMVMEFLYGETCERLVERAGPLSIPHAVRICTQVLDALQYAHRAGVVHRDLKPANVIVTPSGDVKVMDFGIARVQGSEHLTTHGFMVGTPAYMPPEQVRGEEVDPRMDLYAITVVLYRMLTRRLPFQGDTAVAMIHSQLHNPPTPPRQFRADLPDWLDDVLARGLSKGPADRYQSAADFRAALEQGLAGKTTTRPSPDLEETIGPTMTPPAMRAPATQPPVPAPLERRPTHVAPAPAIVTPPPRSVAGTVTLRTPQLVTAAALIAAVAIGALALAFVVMRRAPAMDVPTADSPVASANTAQGAPSAGAPAASMPAPVATAAAPAPSSAVSSTTPAGTGTGTDAARTQPPVGASTRRADVTPRPATPERRPGANDRAATSSGGAGAAPAAAAAPPAGVFATESFDDVRVLVVEGAKSRELEAALMLAPTAIEVRVPGQGSVLRAMPYSTVAAATYVRGRRPRGQPTPGLAQVPADLGGGGFLGTSRHWLSLQTPDEFLVLRLEDRNVVRVMMQIEARTGTKVVRER